MIQNLKSIALSIVFLATLILIMPQQTLAQTPHITFVADRYVINAGECVNISWDVRDVQEVWYNGQPVSGENQTRRECPGQHTMYYLEVLTRDGRVLTRGVGISVLGGAPRPVIQFAADKTQIEKGECVVISWHAQHVKEVYYKGRPVVGENQNRVECPRKTRVYDLAVLRTDGRPIVKTIIVTVNK